MNDDDLLDNLPDDELADLDDNVEDEANARPPARKRSSNRTEWRRRQKRGQ